MSAWHKALINVQAYDPVHWFTIDCVSSDSEAAVERERTDWSKRCEISFNHGLRSLTKFDFIKCAKEEGWVYDKNGDWMCPMCTKEGA
tara:strand:- start:407 stop:670 length:264 start_codon:yes stop_codon:yes gene_type:complete